MSAKNEFENLMNQYSTEAARDQERQERAERRQKMFKTLRKSFLVLVLLGLAGAAWVYRAPLNQQLTKLKLPSTAEMKNSKSERQAKAEGKATEVQQLGQKRVDEFEATIKQN
jgi:hypothetical protein